ncbi:MAG: sn-glycerol-3-phosphate ABC transporter ATP-binding protein UgpC [Betaproteobacteria bacterium]
MAAVSLRNVEKSFGDVAVIQGIDLEIANGEFVVLVGASGCGKSTLLRMIAGLESTTAGDICIGGARVNDLEPRERDIAMVFQSYALYPHLDVRDNMSFSLKLRRRTPADIAVQIGQTSAVLDLDHLLERFPRQLSGGQRQRVAMGRAIVRHPQVFLFDEPLSNLDAQLRIAMRTEIRALHQRLEATSIYVTHDQVEAMTMADRMVVMNAGRVEQIGAPLEVYDQPQTLYVARFIGAPSINVLDCLIDSATRAVVTRNGAVIAAAGADAAAGPVTAAFRPEYLEPDEQGGLAGTIGVVENLGHHTYVFVETADGRLCLLLDRSRRPRTGDAIRMSVRPGQVHLFDPATGLRRC